MAAVHWRALTSIGGVRTECPVGAISLAGRAALRARESVRRRQGQEPRAARDPYVREGLVTSWKVRPWTTVVGEHAATPVR
jgi:uncharacterized protein